MRPNLGMGRLSLEFPPRQRPDGPSPSCFGGIIVHWKKLEAFFPHSYISFVEIHIEYSK